MVKCCLFCFHTIKQGQSTNQLYFFCHGEFFREINFTKNFRENDFTEIHNNNETNHGESIFKNGLFFRVLVHTSACGGNFEDFSFFLFFILLLVIIFPHI